MPDFSFGKGAARRDKAGTPALRNLNMFVEKNPASPTGFILLGRDGLATYTTVGAGPIQGLFSRRGVFSQDLFTISGNKAYRNDALLGTIAGAGPSSFAASTFEVVATMGSNAYSYDGATYEPIIMPDGGQVAAVGFLNGLFIYVKAKSHRFYWSATNDARTIDALDFASAESAPDELLDCYVISDGLWLLGSDTVEFWQYTGSADAPFSRVEGRLYKKGVIATGAAVELDNTLFWWGSDNVIYRGAEVPIAVSDPAIEERLVGSVTRDVFSFEISGHKFLVVRTDTATLLFDVVEGEWTTFATYGRDTWRVQNAAVTAAGLVFGDDTTSTVWRFDADNFDDGTVLEQGFTAVAPAVQAFKIHNLCIEGNSGATEYLTGQGAAPVLEVRMSRNQGKSFGNFRQINLGRQGKYRQRWEKRRWGLVDSPGVVFDFRLTDPARLRVSRVYANEPTSGRGRSPE